MITTVQGQDFQFDPPGAAIKDGTLSGASYKRVGRVAPGSMGRTFASIAAEEEDHIDHAMSILRAERALDSQAFDDKLYAFHLDVMTTLTQIMARDDKDCGCDLCHGGCVKPKLPQFGTEHVRTARRIAAALSPDTRCTGPARREDADVGKPTAGVADVPIEFALIGHQESWRAAADVLAIVR